MAPEDDDLLPVPSTPALVDVGRATVVALLVATAGCSESVTRDSGPSCCDAGFDAGTPARFDAGIAFDAGIMDAGPDMTDAGPALFDAGIVPPDAE